MTAGCSIVTVERQLTAVVKIEAPMNELMQAHQSARARINEALPKLDVGPLGLTCTRWRPPVDGVMPMEPGTIVAKGFAAAGDVVPSELPAGRAAHVVLKGGFEGLGGAWQKLFEWCAVEKLALAGLNWEVYGAPAADPAQQETYLYAKLA
jgi:effector-binding domain-containing protein